MLSRICTVAALFALLTVTTSARASTVEFVNLNFGDGYIASGSISFSEVTLGPFPGDHLFIPDPNVSLFLNGTPLPPLFVNLGQGNPIHHDPIFFDVCGLLPCPFGPPDPRAIAWPVDHIPTNFAEFTLTGSFDLNEGLPIPAISGDVVSAVPLPAALPLFGSGVMMLAGFAVRRRGKVS